MDSCVGAALANGGIIRQFPLRIPRPDAKAVVTGRHVDLSLRGQALAISGVSSHSALSFQTSMRVILPSRTSKRSR